MADNYNPTPQDLEALDALMRRALPLGEYHSFMDGVSLVYLHRVVQTARAEAQDERAAGEREALALDRLANAAEVVRRLLHKTKEVQGPSFREAGISFTAAINHARAVLRQRDALLAHPSPTPAADADRVRIAVEALERAKAYRNGSGVLNYTLFWSDYDQALAALKSEGK